MRMVAISAAVTAAGLAIAIAVTVAVTVAIGVAIGVAMGVETGHASPGPLPDVVGQATGDGQDSREDRASSTRDDAVAASLTVSVRDRASGEPVDGASVQLDSTALGDGARLAFGEGGGVYRAADLPPGIYAITVFYSDVVVRREGVFLPPGQRVRLDIALGAGAVPDVRPPPPFIRYDLTHTGRVFSPDYLQHIPNRRPTSGLLSVVPGGHVEGRLRGGYGTSLPDSTSFSGASALENRYFIDGFDTTDPIYGRHQADLPGEFAQSLTVITGGYQAEYGGSTGAIVDVVTKAGGDRMRGRVFSYAAFGALAATPKSSPRLDQAIETVADVGYDADFGVELHGPIIARKLWFQLGFNPRLFRQDAHRVIHRLVNDDRDPSADGTIELGRRVHTADQRRLSFTAKLTGALSERHQGTLSLFGNPGSGERFASELGAPSLLGTDTAHRLDVDDGSWNAVATWTSQLARRTRLSAMIAGQRALMREYPAREGGDGVQIVFGPRRSLTSYESYEPGGIPADCRDRRDDPLDPDNQFINCAVEDYAVGGVGLRTLDTSERISGQWALSHGVNIAGSHEFKVGASAESVSYDTRRILSGGELLELSRSGGQWYRYRWYDFFPEAVPNDGGDGGDGTLDEVCVVDGVEVACRHARTGHVATTGMQTVAAFAQDTWQPLPQLTIHLGLRWELQRLQSADEVAGRTSSLGGEPVPDVGLTIGDMLAPRIGMSYDPTERGRSKLYGHWGRYYQSLLMNLASRAFSGEAIGVSLLDAGGACPTNLRPADAAACARSSTRGDFYSGGLAAKVAPGLGGAYHDELVLGAEYGWADNVRIGVSYSRKSLGRIVEDVVATAPVGEDGGDGGAESSVIIANPCDIDAASIASDDVYRDALLAIGSLDCPERVYQGLTLLAERRFGADMSLFVSYTLSSMRGNVTGLYSPHTGVLDAHLSSMYDAAEFSSNRQGDLPTDRRHQLIVDGHYRTEVAPLGYFVVGARARVASGMPHSYLGRHVSYGQREVFLLPQGTAARSPTTSQFDLRLQYGRVIVGDIELSAFIDIFNIFNQQAQIDADDEYTEDVVNPIINGDSEDLRHLKRQTSSGADENRVPVVEANFGRTTQRQRPLALRFGLQLWF